MNQNAEVKAAIDPDVEPHLYYVVEIDGREAMVGGLGHGDLIGRAERCELRLADCDRISEFHAAVSHRGTDLYLLGLRGRLWVEDVAKREVAVRRGLRVRLSKRVLLRITAVMSPKTEGGRATTDRWTEHYQRRPPTIYRCHHDGIVIEMGGRSELIAGQVGQALCLLAECGPLRWEELSGLIWRTEDRAILQHRFDRLWSRLRKKLIHCGFSPNLVLRSRGLLTLDVRPGRDEVRPSE